MGSVGVLVVSGAWAGWRELDSVAALWETGYGRLLALKVGLVAGVLVLGAINWKRLSPRLGSEAGNRAMQRSATIEFLLANVVLIVTAILVRTSP
jgi:copper transport protein